MECNRFVDQKIGETHTSEFREHLAGCAGCARDVEELREVRTLYRQASTEKYRGGVPRVGRFRGGWIPMTAAAAILLVVFGLILVPATRTPPKSESEHPPMMFVRVHLEPWAGDLRYTTPFEECWHKLELLEKRP
jgi:hypothetical protein